MITKDTIIISMTSWAPRLNSVASSYKAILNQIEDDMNVHCILVLSIEEFPKKEQELPEDILKLPVEILWTERDIRSHKKLIPTIKKYPDNAILVVDDDICQVGGWLKTFINDHKKYPNDIIFGQSNSICYVDDNDVIHEYTSLYTHIDCQCPGKVSHTQKISSGAAGTLFPAHIINNPDFYNEDLLMEISPTCDETWQWAFALMEGRTFRALSDCNIPIYNTDANDDCALVKTNINILDDIHANIAKRYPLYKYILKEKQSTITVAVYSSGERLKHIHHTLESLILQDMKYHKLQLIIPDGHKIYMSDEALLMEKWGLIEIIYVHDIDDIGDNYKFVTPLIQMSSNITILAGDNRIYPSNMVSTMWNNYLKNPLNIYANQTIKTVHNNETINSNDIDINQPNNNQIALISDGVLIPPCPIYNLLIKDVLKKYQKSPNILLHLYILKMGLNVVNLNTKIPKFDEAITEDFDDTKILFDIANGESIYMGLDREFKVKNE